MLAGALVVTLGIAVGCGSDSEPTAAGTSACKTPLGNARATLVKLDRQSNDLLDCGASAFKRRLEALKGYPVVVNKWASWCGPCRHEFPFFRELARRNKGKIAFLGVDSQDNAKDAREFLDDNPVPYPSFFDPDGEIAEVIQGHRNIPVTSFYDKSGELVLPKQGGYASESALADDIRRYAR